MFAWKIMIQDKDLAKVMWALDGLIVQADPPVPVRGAEVQTTSTGVKKVKATYGNGTIIDRVIAELAGRRSQNISYAEMTNISLTAGSKTRASTGNLIDGLMKRGFLKRLEHGQYVILHPEVPANNA